MKKGHVVLIIAFLLLLFTVTFYFFDYEDFRTILSVPYLALFSLMRMGAAYILSLSFALIYGYITATNQKITKYMLLFIDILQSVPILGFFPAAVLFFMTTIHGRFGMELASVFLIFTSMAWNMALGVYESITTIPKNLIEATNSFGIEGWQKLENLILPACVPKLVYNSIVSWSGGWFFLVASEIISAGSQTHELPGLGSFLMNTTYSGNTPLMLFGLSVLIFIILLLELFIWKPMQSWAEKYKYEYSSGKKIETFFINTLIIKKIFKYIFEMFSDILVSLYIITHKFKPVKSVLKVLLYIGVSVILIYVIKNMVYFLFGIFVDLPEDAYLIPKAILYSFIRLSVAYIICILWTVPVAIYIAKHEKAASYIMPFIEVVASIPAIAFFPLMVVIFMKYASLEIAATLLVLAGMQWYILFNLIAGVKSIPEDIVNAASLFNIKGFHYWKRILIPAMFPSFITGSITGWGGGWNSLIVAEFIIFNGKEYHLFGIGYLLDKATFVTPDSKMVILSVISMSATIILLNKVIWQPLYKKAVTKYKFE